MIAILALAAVALLQPISKEQPFFAELAVYHSAADGAARARELIARKHPELRVRTQEREKGGTSVFIREPPVAKYAPPDSDMLRYFGRGFTPDDEKRLVGSKSVTVLDLTARNADGFAALHALHELVLDLARATSGYVWDDDTREAFTPGEFAKRRLADWQSGAPRASKQYVVHAYPDGELARGVSLGMAKLGLPDLVIEGAVHSIARPLLEVMNLAAQELVEGKRPDASGNLQLEIDSLRDPFERAHQLSLVETGAKKRASIVLREGVRRDGDAENRLLELDFGPLDGREARRPRWCASSSAARTS
ncbi:MAG TPA: hypothetical protein VH083_16905 [Myxococcales bacterium]|nr:hypothetical protein [Myxococcales bacterium]